MQAPPDPCPATYPNHTIASITWIARFGNAPLLQDIRGSLAWASTLRCGRGVLRGPIRERNLEEVLAPPRDACRAPIACLSFPGLRLSWGPACLTSPPRHLYSALCRLG